MKSFAMIELATAGHERVRWGPVSNTPLYIVAVILEIVKPPYRAEQGVFSIPASEGSAYDVYAFP